MEISISQQIIPKDFKYFKQISKKFESNIIPHIGDKITDSFFKDPIEYDVVECIIDYQENKCEIFLSPLSVETESEVNYQVDIAKSHGWETLTGGLNHE
jgi:hypothetical protein